MPSVFSHCVLEFSFDAASHPTPSTPMLCPHMPCRCCPCKPASHIVCMAPLISALAVSFCRMPHLHCHSLHSAHLFPASHAALIPAPALASLQAAKPQLWQVGSVVRIVGNLRSFNQKHSVTAYCIRPVLDHNEVGLWICRGVDGWVGGWVLPCSGRCFVVGVRMGRDSEPKRGTGLDWAWRQPDTGRSRT